MVYKKPVKDGGELETCSYEEIGMEEPPCAAT